jgi:hypothetical protein
MIIVVTFKSKKDNKYVWRPLERVKIPALFPGLSKDKYQSREVPDKGINHIQECKNKETL